MFCHRDRRMTKPVARRPLRPTGVDGMRAAAALPLYPDIARWPAASCRCVALHLAPWRS
jgi:hypothetical protein